MSLTPKLLLVPAFFGPLSRALVDYHKERGGMPLRDAVVVYYYCILIWSCCVMRDVTQPSLLFDVSMVV